MRGIAGGALEDALVGELHRAGKSIGDRRDAIELTPDHRIVAVGGAAEIGEQGTVEAVKDDEMRFIGMPFALACAAKIRDRLGQFEGRW